MRYINTKKIPNFRRFESETIKLTHISTSYLKILEHNITKLNDRVNKLEKIIKEGKCL